MGRKQERREWIFIEYTACNFSTNRWILAALLRLVLSSISHMQEKLSLRKAHKGCMWWGLDVKPTCHSVPLQWGPGTPMAGPTPTSSFPLWLCLERELRICSIVHMRRGKSRSRGQTFLGNPWNNKRYRISVEDSPRQTKIWLNNWMEAKFGLVSQGHRLLLGWFVGAG